MKLFDVVVVGGGPAGMAAATLAAKHGASVAILDEQQQLGGQIYRNVTQTGSELRKVLGPDYVYGEKLANEFGTQEITHISSATVWSVTTSGQLLYSVNGSAHQIAGRFVVLATGALERPAPIKGWTLPGVMTAGAAQILIKTSGLVPERAVLAGSGPLIYLLAAQMVAADVPPAAIVETQTWADHFRALKHLTGAIRGWRAIYKGLSLLRTIRGAGVQRYTGARNLEVIGQSEVEGIRVLGPRGRERTISCDTVLLHQGVIPNTQMTQALRLDHDWCPKQRCFKPVTDKWGSTSCGQVFVAGDGAGIGGAGVAEHQGRLSALEALYRLGTIESSTRDELARTVLKDLDTELAVRPFLDVLYSVPEFIARPQDDVLVCRCEEVTAGDIRKYARLGCTGPNQTKAFGRCGMGACQGRYCGLTVTDILAGEHGVGPEDVGSYRIRMPIKPVTLAEIAQLSTTDVEKQVAGPAWEKP